MVMESVPVMKIVTTALETVDVMMAYFATVWRFVTLCRPNAESRQTPYQHAMGVKDVVSRPKVVSNLVMVMECVLVQKTVQTVHKIAHVTMAFIVMAMKYVTKSMVSVLLLLTIHVKPCSTVMNLTSDAIVETLLITVVMEAVAVVILVAVVIMVAE